jgi:hypothetical protein
VSDWTWSAPDPAVPIEAGQTPTFSVVIAAYQAADMIGEAIESALTQTVPPLEVIVSDDGSTDDLASALAPFGKRVTLLRGGENAGPAAARNRAAREAAGDFLAVLDADDVWLPRRLEALSWLGVQRPDLDLLTTNEILEYEGVELTRSYRSDKPFVVARQDIVILDHDFLAHAAVRRTRFLAIGGYEESLRACSDWDLWARLILGGARAGAIEEPLVRYRLTDGSITSDSLRTRTWRLRVVERMLARDDLTADQRSAAERSLEKRRRELRLVEARHAAAAGASGHRAIARSIVRDPAFPLSSRIKAGLTFVAPSLARTVLAARGRGASGHVRDAQPRHGWWSSLRLGSRHHSETLKPGPSIVDESSATTKVQD